eukprot:9638783-Lingulodinium_polyedra.AAC.1
MSQSVRLEVSVLAGVVLSAQASRARSLEVIVATRVNRGVKVQTTINGLLAATSFAIASMSIATDITAIAHTVAETLVH